jgi:small subunit ribosomal protein S16
MAVVIRMKRSGRRNRPCYRITVADSRAPRDGRVLESLGLYDPIAPDKEAQVVLDVERAKHWVAAGAQPSETGYSIFKRNGVYEGASEPKKRDRSGRKKKTKTRERRDAAKQGRAVGRAERRTARQAAKAEKPAAEA